MRLIFTSALYTRNYGIIVIFTDPGLGSEKIMSQFDLWPIQVWHFILWSLYLLFLFRIIFCIITLVNKWHLFMGVTHKPIPITATFQISLRPRSNGLFLFGNCGNSFEGIRRHGASKNEEHGWRDNPDTKSTKTKIFNRIFKILLWKLRPWLWAPQTKFHSSSLYVGEGLNLIIKGYALYPSPNTQDHRRCILTAYGQNT